MASGEHIRAFERIRQLTDDGHEYWSARELANVLGYSGWQRFRAVINKAQTACEGSGQAITDHFNATVKMVEIGSGSQREIEDWELSRYACYLIVQNADPSKDVVALGQTYFAVQTRRQELADEALLAGMTEDQKRLYIREQLKQHNKQLSAAAKAAGVVTSQDFATFHDHGYRGLYGGLNARDLAFRKNLKKGQQILDHMGSTELAANLFRATQTEDKLRRDNVGQKERANQTHWKVGNEVRQTIQRLGGTMPEKLPTPTESIDDIKRKQGGIAGRRQTPAIKGASSRRKATP